MTSSTSAAVGPVPHPAPFEAGRPFSSGRASSLLSAIFHLLVNLPLGIAYFVLLVTGLALGAGLLITLLGIPILVGTGWLVRTLGNIERARINGFLGMALRDPYRPAAPATGWIARLSAVGKDPATWRDFLFLILRLPMGIVTFTVTVTSWSLALGLLLSPVADGVGVFRLDVVFWVSDGPLGVTCATLAGGGVRVRAGGVT
jgi:hypothetical protein